MFDVEIAMGHFYLIVALSAISLAGCSGSSASSKPTASHEHPGGAKTAGMDMPHDHMMMGAAGQLMVKTEPAEIKPGQPTKLSMMVHDTAGAMVMSFDTIHEKKVHLIIVRDGLEFFSHVHPDLDAMGGLTTEFTFPTPGLYRLYADQKPAGKPQAVALATLTVPGTAPPKPVLTPNVPGDVTTDSLKAKIAIDKAAAGSMGRVTFALFDRTDKPITDLQPYLGAMGHLVIISEDGKDYVHAHPVEGAAASGPISFDAHFPKAGLYGGWGQFQRGGAVLTVPFVVAVK
jgi:hypothetical protein